MRYIALFLAMIFWATSFAYTKEVLVQLDAIFVMWVRLSVASIFFILAAPFLPWPQIRGSLRPGDPLLIGVMVLSEPCLYFLCETYALKYTSAALAGVMAGLFPLAISMGAWIFFKQSSPPLFWFGSLLAVCGVAVMTFVSSPVESSPNPVLGNVFMLGAVLLGTSYTLIASKLSSRINAAFLTAIQAWGGTVFYTILCFSPWARSDALEYSNRVPWGHFPAQVTLDEWQKLIYLGICVSVGSYGLFAWAIGKIPAMTVAILINFIPIMSLIFAMIHLGESLSAVQVGAISVVLAGVFSASWARR